MASHCISLEPELSVSSVLYPDSRSEISVPGGNDHQNKLIIVPSCDHTKSMLVSFNCLSCLLSRFFFFEKKFSVSVACSKF